MEKPVDPRESEIERIMELLSDTTDEAAALDAYRREAEQFEPAPAAARALLDILALETDPAGVAETKALIASLRERLARQGDHVAAALLREER